MSLIIHCSGAHSSTDPIAPIMCPVSLSSLPKSERPELKKSSNAPIYRLISDTFFWVANNCLDASLICFSGIVLINESYQYHFHLVSFVIPAARRWVSSSFLCACIGYLLFICFSFMPMPYFGISIRYLTCNVYF